MAEILAPSKPLCVNPLKASQPVGASLAFLGMARAMPLEHGARGCTSFNKLFFMRHFNEPIALQTTAMDQVTTVIGADSNVVEALATICGKPERPDIIGLISTALAETQGADLTRTIRAFRDMHPGCDDVIVVPVSASDTLGCLESGFALAVEAMLAECLPPGATPVRRPLQVNILAGAMLSPGDVEALRAWVEAFGLTAIILPDIADSLDGHLIDAGYSTLTYGGTPAAHIAGMAVSAATLVVGPSLARAAALLEARTGITTYHFASLTGLLACNRFSDTLAAIAGLKIPAALQRQRAQLEDAMVDCQFQFGGARMAIAADADLLAALAGFVTDMGADIVAAVASARAPHLASLPVQSVIIGDLEDAEWLAREQLAELIIANSHGTDIARRLGAAHLRAGFPIYDQYGAHARCFIGYQGTRALVFEIANLLAAQYREIAPYRSRFWAGTPREREAAAGSPC